MRPSTRTLWEHLAAALLLLGLACLVYAPLLVPGRAPYSAFSDVLAWHLPIKRLGYDYVRAHGSLPLWRIDQLGGAVALGNPQALYLHPSHAPFWFLPPLAAVGPTFVLQLFINALGSYALARVLSASWLAGLFCGAAGLVAFKLILAVYAGWLAPLVPIALVPWFIAGMLRLAERPDRARTVQLALISALCFAGGNPQPLYYAALLAAPYLAVAAHTRAPERAFGQAVRASALAVGAIALGVACSAYLWLSVAYDWPLVARAGDTADYAFFLSGHALGIDQLWTLLQPHVLGTPTDEPWEDTAYWGWVPLSLALWAAASSRKRGAQRYLAWALLASVLLSLDTPLLRLVYSLVPGYASFRLPGRMLFVTSALGIALAGPGLDRVLAKLDPRVRIALALALTLAVTLEGAHYAGAYLETRPQAELVPDRAHPARNLTGTLGARTAVAGRATLNYGWGEDLGLTLITGYDSYLYTHYRQYMTLLEQAEIVPTPGNWVDMRQIRRPDLLNELSVKYLLAAQVLPFPQLRLLRSQPAVRNFVMYQGLLEGPLYVYDNRSARPYARFASATLRVASLARLLQYMTEEELSGQAYVLQTDAPTPEPAPQNRAQRIHVDRVEPGDVQLQAESGKRELLVISEVFHPGWQARVDGQPVRVLQANLALLGVWLEPGAHRVHLTFDPSPLAWGLRISVAALALLLLGVAFELAKRVQAARR